MVRPLKSDPNARAVDLLPPRAVRPHEAERSGGAAPAGPRAKKKRTETIVVRRIHRRDLNRVWEFLKLSFRDVNRATVEYQRPRTKQRFLETYEEEGVEQLLFAIDRKIVAYAECTFEIVGKDTWVNPAYFERRDSSTRRSSSRRAWTPSRSCSRRESSRSVATTPAADEPRGARVYGLRTQLSVSAISEPRSTTSN